MRQPSAMHGQTSHLARRLESGRRENQTGHRSPGIQDLVTHSDGCDQAETAGRHSVSVEFPVSVKKSTRKPHYMTASEQAKVEIAAPGYLRDIVVNIVEDCERDWRYATDQSRPRRSFEANICFPSPSSSKEAYMTICAKVWAGTLKSRAAIFRPLRTSARVRYPAERERRRRSYGDRR